MADRKPFLLRVDRTLLDAVQRWANDDLRSLNGQIEFLLRDALRRAGRQPARARRAAKSTGTTHATDTPPTPDAPIDPDHTDAS